MTHPTESSAYMRGQKDMRERAEACVRAKLATSRPRPGALTSAATSALENAARAIRALPLSSTPAGGDDGWQVKPLKWKAKGDDWYAESPVGHYAVGLVGGKPTAILRCIDDERLRDTVIGRGYRSVGAAKTAVQAHFDATIRSALLPPAPVHKE